MSANNTRFSTKLACSAPGKAFLLGEYAVLAGMPALVTTVAPRFELSLESSAPLPFDAESPAGKLLKKLRLECPPDVLMQLGGSFADPFQGLGGLGASTAQFALLYYAATRLQPARFEPNWKSAWTLYRDLHTGEGPTPSGADLVAQWEGGTVLFQPRESIQALQCQNVSQELPGFFFFQATVQEGRKIATHQHLEVLKSRWPSLEPDFRGEAQELLAAGIQAWGMKDLKSFGELLSAYAGMLADLELESGAAQADRLAFENVRGVFGVKGCGALLADTLVVVAEPAPLVRDSILNLARERGLRLISEGLKIEPGIREERGVA